MLFPFEGTPFRFCRGRNLLINPVQVLETADSGDEKAITAMGLLNTMETILAVMEEKPEVLEGVPYCALCSAGITNIARAWSRPSIARNIRNVQYCKIFKGLL
jgi:hypothetical protein